MKNTKVLILYWSKSGNTEKVAKAIEKGVSKAGFNPVLKKVEEAGEEELYDYDLVCLGAPSYGWQAPKPVQEYVKKKMDLHRSRGEIKIGAPKVPGRNAVVFCTYSGPHTGINEAIPVGKYLGQFFEHIGFELVGEWYAVGEFHGSEELSTKGSLGNIRGRPNTQDLDKIEKDTLETIKSLQGGT